MYLIIDIETIPNQHIEKPIFDESTVKVGNLKDHAKIADKIAEAREEFETGLSKRMSTESDLCEIVSLGMITVDNLGKVISEDVRYYDDGDANIVRTFEEKMKSRPVLVTWNGKRFDIPVLFKRSLAHRAPFASAIAVQDMCNPYRSEKHIDLMLLFNAGGMGKLSTCAKFLGIPAKDGMDGSMVYDAYKAGDHAKIQQYNMNDCRACLAIAKRLGVIV